MFVARHVSKIDLRSCKRSFSNCCSRYNNLASRCGLIESGTLRKQGSVCWPPSVYPIADIN